MLMELGKRIEEYCEYIDKKLENMKKNQSEMKTMITTMKYTLEEINRTLVIQRNA